MHKNALFKGRSTLVAIVTTTACSRPGALIFIQKRRKKRVKCLFLYLKLNTTLQIGTSTIHSDIIRLTLIHSIFPGSECEHTNRLFISVQLRSFLLKGKRGETFI